MRKWFITLLTLLLAFTACRQEEPVSPDYGNIVDFSKLRFNLTILHPDAATKGVKTDWENGDKVFIFISGCTTGYITTSNSGSAWTAEYVGTPTLGESGYVHAVYLPYGNSAQPTYSNNKWTFDEGTDTYYFCAGNVPYTVETIGEEQIFSATIQMVKPQTYVQFYIPYASASGTIQLACNALRPAVITGVSATDGAVTLSTGTAGTPVTGYADTLDGEEGYYVSGIPVIAGSETADYYFALKKGDDYSHFYKNRNALVANKAYQLPAYSSWPRVGGSRHVMVANGSWKTENEGAEHPWDLGELKDNSFVPLSGEDLPDETDWSNLIDSQKATWMPMDIWGSHGSLVLSASASNKYIYIPWSGSVTNYWMAGFANSFDIADNGTSLVIPNPASIPGSGLAYVRLIEKVVAYDGFTIEARTAGTIIKFRYGTSGSTYVQYSTDGSNWSNYTANAAITLTNVGDKVSFRTNMSSLGKGNGDNTKLFTSTVGNSNVNCYVYGELMYLLCDKDGDTWTPRTVLGEANFQRTFRSLSNMTLKEGKKLTLTVTQVGQSSCKLMFQDCTGFTETPIDCLPEATIQSGTNQAYASMFQGCSNMTTAPELPATTLGTSCYLTMFSGCSSLTESPVLPAPTIATTAYQGMFKNCSKLKKITCLATSGMGGDNTKEWVSGVAASGTFIKAPSADWGGTGAAKIPPGWTVENYSE